VAVLGYTFSSYPYKILSSNIEFFEIIRLPYRAYFISNLALAVIAVVGINEILKKINKKQQFILIFLIAIIHIAENIPYPFPLSDYEFIKNEISINYGIKLQSGFDAKNIAPSTQLIKAVKTNTNEESVLLCLPSNRIFGEEHGMFCYNRELIYMNHQSYFNRNMFNGVHGYFPNSRIEIQNKIDKLPTQVGFLKLSESGLTHIIYYKNMIIDSKDDIIEELKQAELLNLVEETKDYIIFELK